MVHILTARDLIERGHADSNAHGDTAACFQAAIPSDTAAQWTATRRHYMGDRHTVRR